MPRGAEGLHVLLPAVADWFRSTFGNPTPPQRLGWPAIAAGQNTLIFAPTGSGKTLAAFLACLDHLWRRPPEPRPTSTRILYVSPLKALNQDVHRNLQVPLEGVLETSSASGRPLRRLTVGLRTGDTTPADRRTMARRPPEILITTPESLHLLLTSRARETLRGISHVLIDEIHALCPNKRGVFLALLLERLEALNPAGFVRVGLSATQRPLEEVARYLGGLRVERARDGFARFVERAVTIIDAGGRKKLDLEVAYPGTADGPTPGGSMWPSIESRLVDLIRGHRSTIVFANNRRLVERLTARLNDRAGTEDDPDAIPMARAHHGSLSLDERRGTEDALKRGELAAVVATASLELGIDMGAVDLVCQVESPGSVARGLQRVGRAGHLVGRESKGRLLAKTAGDLLESAALCRAMLSGEVEALRVPTHCLDVLAQQIVACVAMDRWSVPELFDLVRRAYPYRDLPAAAFEAVLNMVSGRYPAATFRDLRPRISWDRVHNTLHPLPGSAQLALVGGGTIPDTGQFPLFLGYDGPRLGELDEEFVLERRVGETFMLGSSTWRIEAIEPHKVVVGRAEGHAAFVPFWRGEDAPRTAELGEAVGALVREVAGRLDDPALPGWLGDECRLDGPAARRLRDHVARQVRQAGAAPDDRTVLVESFRDPAGEVGLAVLTPFGGKLHHALKLALQARLRDRLGIQVACLHADDGVLVRLPGTDEPPLDVFEGLTPEVGEALVRESLGDSALFGLRFRQAAGRALLMPRPDPARRTPLWLQRLRAKDLLQVVRNFPDFPVVVEAYRECLVDDLDLPRLRAFLDRLARGEVRVVARRGELPSPFASELVFKFTQKYLYEWDHPERGDQPRRPAEVDADLLDPLLDPDRAAGLLDEGAIGRVEDRLRGVGRPPRTVDEMAETLRRLGDLAPSELFGPMLTFAGELRAQGRAVAIELAGTVEPARWVLAEEADDYARAFAEPPDEQAVGAIVGRYLRTHALVGMADLVRRYPIGPAMATEILEREAEAGGLVRVDGAGETPRWADRRNLEEVRRLSIALKRRESVAVPPEVFADFVARRQHAHPSTRREGQAAVELALDQLHGFAAPADLWEAEILPRRVRDFRPAWLDEALAGGGWTWRAGGDGRGEPRVAFTPRDFGGRWPSSVDDPEAGLAPAEAAVLGHLRSRGACFAADLAREAGLSPSAVRQALDGLLRRGLATNDRFDPLRPGGRAVAEALASAASAAEPPRRGGPFRSRPNLRRLANPRPEGRWSVIPGPGGDDEGHALAWAAALLDRYGVLTRETATLDAWAPPWRDLVPHLSRAEWRGELRRGFFVEGLSGLQYATAEAAEALASHGTVAGADRGLNLLATLDPANLYGSGAPLDVPLLEGGTARLVRSPGSFLALCGGRPVLIIEGYGRRLTGLASASEEEIRAAIGLLPGLAGPARRVLKVETYNAIPALSGPAAPWLAEVGFVRDPPGLAFYAGW